MATQLQLRRGTTQANDLFTGANGEVTVDTTTHGLRVHSGFKQGGYLVDTVVFFQKPTQDNNYTWARKYASGWVEQGGVFATVNTSYHTESITLPVEMANTNYNCHISCASSGSVYMPLIQSKTTTGFVAYNVVNTPAYAGGWTVCGMAA